MRSSRLASFIVVFISIAVLAQSGHGQQNSPSHNQQQHSGGAPFPSHVTERLLSARGINGGDVGRKRILPPQGVSFANAVDYGTGAYQPGKLVATDVNGDGKPDIVVANRCGDGNCNAYNTYGMIGVLLGNGDGTFQTAVAYPSGGYDSRAVSVADVNGDGKPDLIVPNYGGTDRSTGEGTVGVLLGNGDGTFQTAVAYPSSGYFPYSVAIEDVNGDGKPDLVVANACGDDQSCNGNASVAVLLGNGDGTFQTPVTYDSGGLEALSVVLQDVNSDGKLDIVVANGNRGGTYGLVGILLGNGDGTFQAAVTYATGGYDTDNLAVQDVNGDGKPDVVVVNFCEENSCQSGSRAGVLLGNGDGTFQPVVLYDSGGSFAYSVAVGDVNQDGDPDLLAANFCETVEFNGSCDGSGTLGLLLGNGDGTFQTALTYDSGGYAAYDAIVQDVNGDGKLDLIASNDCDSNDDCSGMGLVGVLLNTSTQATATALTSSQNPSNYGQGVTFTATVTVQGTGTPSGTVSFYDGAANIGNVNLNSNGVATLTTSTLTVGTHNMTATYNGNSNFLPSTSPPLYQVVQGAITAFSPTSLNFGNQTVGVPSTPQNVMLTNTGNINLSISLIQITGTNMGDFSQTNNCPASLAPNSSCNIAVTFTPMAAGTRNAAVSVSDNAPNSPQSVPLTGTGIASVVTFSPSNLNFGNQPVGTTSNPLPVKLSTNGTLNVRSITTSAQFNQTNNCPSQLPPGGSCTINVTFTPSAPGLQNGTLSVSDDGQSSPQTVPLSGTGTQPAVGFNPPNLNFGNQTVGIKSSALVSTLTNTGSGTLSITMIQVTGANSGDFSEMNNCPGSLPPNGSCNISVTFTPKTTGTRNATVSVTDNAPGSPQSLPLTGIGVLPSVTFNPSSLTFPTTVVYTTSAPQKVTLTNSGLGVLEIKGAKVSAQFGVTTNCGNTVASGASCTAEVKFKPTTKGQINGSITLTDNAPDSPQQVPLSGTGTFVDLTPTSLNFGTQPINTTSPTKYITLENKGTGAVNLTGSGITITGADPGDFAQQNNCPNSLPSGSLCKIKVTFTPTQQGKRTADISISDDGGGSPQLVPLAGTGTP